MCESCHVPVSFHNPSGPVSKACLLYTSSSASVWAEANRYYIDGKSISLPLKLFAEADADIIAEELKRRTPSNDGSHFPEMIDRFIAANKHHLNALKEEAYSLAGTYFS